MAWKARVVLFMGFAAMAGGLAGGVCVMVLKYITEGAEGVSLWFGAANLVGNSLVMLRYVPQTKNMSQSHANHLTVPWCSGSARTWRTITPTTWPCNFDDSCTDVVLSNPQTHTRIDIQLPCDCQLGAFE